MRGAKWKKSAAGVDLSPSPEWIQRGRQWSRCSRRGRAVGRGWEGGEKRVQTRFISINTAVVTVCAHRRAGDRSTAEAEAEEPA